MSQKNKGVKQNPTTVIKCSFSNAVHKLLEPNVDKKSSQRWKFKKELTDKEKIEMFDEIMKLHSNSSNELTNYQFDRREKKRIHKARVERGYKFKKKTSKEEYEKNLVVSI
jgi:hypothetical protein